MGAHEYSHPFCAYRPLLGFSGHRCYFSSHCYTHKYSRGTATQTNTNPVHIHPSMASPQRTALRVGRAYCTKFFQRPVGDTVLRDAWMQSGSVAWLKQSRFVVAAGATTPSSYGASCCPWTSSQTVLGEQWRVLPGFWAPTALQQLLLQPAWSSSSSSPSSPCLPAWHL